MRWWAVLVLCAGCAFEVPAVGPGPGAVGGGADQPNGSNGNGGTATAPTSPTTPPTVASDDGGMVPQSTQIGDPCDNASVRCSAGQVCETQTAFGTPIPGGYCSMDCHMAPCPTGSQCAMSWGAAFRVCIEDCPAAGCRAGFVCCKQGWKQPGACLPPSLCPGG